MDNLVNEFPSEDNPFVNVGKEVRSKWVPVMGNHDDAGDGSNLARQMAYAGEALKQDHSGNVYWTAQGLHASDGTIVARNLGQAAQLLVETGWVSDTGIHWQLFANTSEERTSTLKAAAKKLGFC
ncbi:hypothetical protein ACOI93_10870 [Corynebacterium striatum]|uniref:hypothetical protein n=1 Tax=Corynebacterium striatum TaxID=43770 RepID=UPI001FC8DAD4|nr:hypothetical protein [Corynebacterium striatum]GKH17227.1 hypothetical protein CE91St29_15400 [Corynebacterium striatum]